MYLEKIRNTDGSLKKGKYEFTDDTLKAYTDEVRSERDVQLASQINRNQFVPGNLTVADGDPDVKKAYGTDDIRGLRAARTIKAFAQATLTQRNVLDIVKGWNGEKNPLDGEILKALTESQLTAGGALVPPNFMPEVIELLRPAVVVRSLNPTIVPLVDGNMSIPRQTGAASASYVGETQAATASQETTDLLQLTAKELVALVPVSNKLLRHSGIAADTFIRNDLVKVLAIKEDYTFILSPGSQATPKGILNWMPSGNKIPSVYTGDSAGTVAQITTDVQAALAALANANVDMTPGKLAWIMHPRTEYRLKTIVTSLGIYPFREEMVEQGTFFGIRFRSTTQIPINLAGTYGSGHGSYLFLVNTDELVIGEDLNTMIEVFPNATYTDANSNVITGVNSMQTVIRSVSAHDFQMRHDVAAAVITDVVYGYNV